MKNNKRRTPKIHKQRANSRQGQRDSSLSGIIEISRILSSNLDMDTIWDALHDHISVNFDTTSFFIALYDYERDQMTFPLASEDGIRVHHEPIPVCGMSRAIMVHGVEFYVQDAELEAERLQALGIEPDDREPGRWARSWIGVPLRSRQSEVAGLIALQNLTPNSFNDHDLSLLMAMGAPLSLALDTLKISETERERRLMAAALMEIGQLAGTSLDYDDVLERILDQLQRVISYDSAAILLPAGEERLLIVGASHDPDAFVKGASLRAAEFSPLAQSLSTQQPVVVADAAGFATWWEEAAPESSRIHSWLIVPLAVQQKVSGLILLGKLALSGYTQKDASSAFALGRQGAVVMETTRLETQSRANLQVLQQRARRLASINRITGVITSSLDRDEVFFMTAQLLIELFEADHCGIAMMVPSGEKAVLTAEFPETGALGLAIPMLDNGKLEYLTRYATALAIDDLEDGSIDDVTRAALRQFGVKAALIAPLIVRDQVIGTLSIDMTSGTRVFTDEECETLVTIAGQVAMAVSRAGLYEEALADNRLRSSFIANVSHELRTPLNTIIGYSDMLLSEYYGALNEQQCDRVSRINSGGRRLLGVLDDVLVLSKIEAGQIDLSLQALPVSEIVNAVATAYRLRAEEKKLAFAVELAEDEPLVRADRTYLAEILNNLLDNAVKFTASGEVRITSLLVTVRDGHLEQIPVPPRLNVPDGEWLALRIMDTGIGIRVEDQEMIFESFRQVDSSQTREYEGSGLGLTISLRLVQMHNGFLWVESEPGAGSTFTILLPTSRPGLLVTPEPEPAPRPLVLVIDDGTADRQLINEYLGDSEYQIICTDDAEEGLVIAGELQPDVVIADRANDGASIVTRLEANGHTETIPVIVIAAAADGVGDGEDDGVLVKPLEADALRARVRQALDDPGL